MEELGSTLSKEDIYKILVVDIMEGSMLMIAIGKVRLCALLEGSLEVITFFYFSSVATRDGRVVLVVPLGIH